MPTYEYACTECGERLEVVQRFSDDPLTVCPTCQGKLRKLFSPVGVVFKGSGFYKTDSRGGKQKTATAAASTDAGSGAATESAGEAKNGSDAAATTTTDSSKPASPAPPATSDSTGGGSKVA